MAGENFILYFLILFLQGSHSTTIIKQPLDPIVFIRGGILFEQVRDTPVTINPPTVLFTRRLNFSKIEDAVWQTQSFSKEYKKFCDILNDKMQLIIKANNVHEKYFITENAHLIKDSKNICKQKHAALPEIRNAKTYEELTQMAYIKAIRYIPAGVYPEFHSGTLRFLSDSVNAETASNIFPNIHYQTNNTNGPRKCVSGGRGGYANDVPCLRHINDSIGVFYVHSQGEWTLNIVPAYRYSNISNHIICEKLSLNDDPITRSHLLLKMAAHTCTRDLINIQNTANIIIEEASHFVRIDKERSNEMKKLSRRNDYQEYNNFRGFHIVYKDFCIHHMSSQRTSPCDKFEKYLEILQTYSYLITEKTQIPEEFVGTYMALQSLSLTQIITLEEEFNPCTFLINVQRINLDDLNDDLARLVTYIKISSRICAQWHNNQFTSTYREKLKRPEIAMLSLPVFEAFYKLRFTSKLSPSGKNLTMLNEMMANDKVQMYKMTSHPSITKFLTTAQKEVLYNLNNTTIKPPTPVEDLTLNANKPLNMTLKRIKRLGFSTGTGLTFLAGDLIVNTIRGRPMFDTLGKGLASISGLVHRTHLDPFVKLLEANSKTIETLQFNQEEIEKAYQSMQASMLYLDDFQRKQEFSTATMFQQIDHKIGIQELLHVLESSILKLANIITNSLMGSTSPYLLSQDKLNEIAIKYRAQNIHLSNDLSEVATMKGFYLNNELTFPMSIPILNEKDKYRVYKASPIPIFTHDSDNVYEVDIDTKYLAYSTVSNHYRILTEEEFAFCRLSKFCTISDVSRPITPDSHCVIRTLSRDISACKLKKTENKEPYFHVSGTNMVYSIKGPMRTTLLCPSHPGRQIINIDGIGTAKVEPGCEIQFENDMHIYINPIPDREDLGEIELMKLFEYIPRINNFTHQVNYNNFSSITVYQPNLKQVNFTFKSLLEEVINPSQALPEAMRVIGVIIIIVIIFLLICCCSKKFAIWFKTCIFWKNPKTYWVDIKNYDLGTFNKYRQQAKSNIPKYIPNFIVKYFSKPSNEEPNPIIKRSAVSQNDLNIGSPLLKKNRTVRFNTPDAFEYSTDNYTEGIQTGSYNLNSRERIENGKQVYPTISYKELRPNEANSTILMSDEHIQYQQNPYYAELYPSSPNYAEACKELDSLKLERDMEEIKKTIVIDQPISQFHQKLFVK